MRFAGGIPNGINDAAKVTAEFGQIDTLNPQKNRSEFIIFAEIPAAAGTRPPTPEAALISEANQQDQRG